MDIGFDRADWLAQDLPDLAILEALDVPQDDCHAISLGQRGNEDRELLPELGALPHSLGLSRPIRLARQVSVLADPVEWYQRKPPAAYPVAESVECDLVEPGP